MVNIVIRYFERVLQYWELSKRNPSEIYPFMFLIITARYVVARHRKELWK